MKITLCAIRLLALLFVISPVFSQSIQNGHTEKLNRYIELMPQEKLFVHIDKPYYAVSDNIWFNTYVVDAKTHIPRKESLAYIELINPQKEVIAKRNVQIVDGAGFGDFDLSQMQLEPGDYTLRGYTNYMRNFDEDFFFRQRIQLVSQNVEKEMVATKREADINIKFFPEGGELVAGEINFVAFKVTGDFDASDQISGVIYDEEEKTVAQFRTEKFGMGLVPIKPAYNSRLTAKVDYKGRTFEFDLPEILNSGFTMSVRNTGENLLLLAKHSNPEEMNSAFIIIHQRGSLLSVISAQNGASIQNLLKLDDLPTGIISFTLFDADGVPRRERIAFVENDKLSRKRVAITTDKSKFRTRERVSLSLKNSDGTSMEGTGSMSITDLNLVPIDSRESHLLSYLLLSSDIKGEIKNPAYYFNKDNKDRLKHLDMLMLTQGWRRFTWKEVLKDNEFNFSYPVEKGITIKGRVVDYYNPDNMKMGQVQLNILEDLTFSEKIISDENGNFEFNNLRIGDTATVILQSKKFNTRNQSVSKNNSLAVQLVDQESPNVLGLETEKHFIIEDQTIDSYLTAFNKMKSMDSIYSLDGVILLDEFSVSSRKGLALDVMHPFRLADALYGTPSKRVIIDSLDRITANSRVFDVLRSTSGVMVRGAFPNETVFIRGFGAGGFGRVPTMLLDGVEVPASALNAVSINDVAFIDVFNGPDAAAFGPGSGGGVLSVFTRFGPRSNLQRPTTGINIFKVAGYSLGREFYTPDYSEKSDKHKRPDLRSTLYWNPDVDFTDEYPIEFYTSDEKGSYLIHLEGITPDGKIILEEKIIEVK